MLIVYPPFSGLSLNLLAMWKPLTGWNSICQNKIKINLQRVLGIVVAWNTLLLKHRLIIVDLSATMKHINWVCMWAWRWNIAQTGGSLTIGPQNSVHIWCQYGKKHSEHRSTLFASPDTNRFELREKIMAKKKKKKDIAMFDVGFKLRGISKCFIASLTKSFNFGRCRQVLLVSNTKA